MISIFMLCVLGMTLGAEVLAKMGPLDACEALIEPPHHSVEFTSDRGWEKAHGPFETERCPDPCHAGQAHFGHCSFISMQAGLRLPFLDLPSTHRAFLKAWPDDPWLEGLRRPPRRV